MAPGWRGNAVPRPAGPGVTAAARPEPCVSSPYRRKHAHDPSVIAVDGRVGEGEPGSLLEAIASGDERPVLEVVGSTREGGVDQRLQVWTRRRTRHRRTRRRAQRGAWCRGAGVGIIVEKAEPLAPSQEHRKAGIQHEPDDRAERLRPSFREPQRPRSPVMRPHPRAHVAPTRQEAQSEVSRA